MTSPGRLCRRGGAVGDSGGEGEGEGEGEEEEVAEERMWK